MSLQGCDFNDFLMCWGFLSIREDMVLFTPHSGSTVFFGNLYDDLAYAFVDFPTRCDAMKAVACIDGKAAFRTSMLPNVHTFLVVSKCSFPLGMTCGVDQPLHSRSVDPVSQGAMMPKQYTFMHPFSVRNMLRV